MTTPTLAVTGSLGSPEAPAQAATKPARSARPVAHAAAGALAKRVVPVLPAVATALGAVLLWEAMCAWLRIPEMLLPAPSGIARAMVQHLPTLAGHALATTLETVASFAVAAALGIVVASALTLSSLLKDAVYPYIVALQTVPKVALAPLFTVWLSIGFTSRLAIAVFVSVFSILVPLMAGLRATPPDALRMARCAGASRWQAFVHVRFPYALGYLFSGLKIASTTVVIGVVVGEFITSEKGLGYLIMYSASRLETPVVMAAITCLCVIGLALYGFVAWLDAYARRWLS